MASRLGALVVALALSLPLMADGAFILPSDLMARHRGSSAAQKAVLLREGPDQVLLLQTTYRGPASRFAWVIPVPKAPSDVFLAEPAFLEELFRRTEPRVRTDLETRSWLTEKLPLMFATFSKTAGTMGGPGGPPVQVLQRLALGPFDAAVLAAVDGGKLTQWLRTNGFAWPTEGAGLLGDYVKRGWVFVALRMRPQGSGAAEVLKDVPPVGLKFPYAANRMVFPLAISRLSAPAQTSIILCLVADQPYVCETMPTRFVDHATRLPRGQTTGDLRRSMTREGGPATLCEVSRPGVLPYKDLGYRQNVTGSDLTKAHVTRHFLLLKPEEMRDLSFAATPADPHKDYQLLIERHARLNVQALWALQPQSLLLRPSPDGQRLTGKSYALSEEPSLALSGRQADVIGGTILLILLSLVIAAFSRRDNTVGCVLLILYAVLLPILGGVMNRPLHNYQGLAGRADTLMARLDQAAQAFRDDTGAYPATVSDLAATTAPAAGLDASGNEVAIKSGWQGPYLSVAPADPTGGRDFAIDPLNVLTVDATGFWLTIRPVSQDRVLALFPRERAEKTDGQYWQHTEAELLQGLQGYAAWMRDTKPADLWVLPQLPRWGHDEDQQALLVDHRRGRGLAFPVRDQNGGIRRAVAVNALRLDTATGAFDRHGGKGIYVSALAGPGLTPRALPRAEESSQDVCLGVTGQVALIDRYGGAVHLKNTAGNSRKIIVPRVILTQAAFSPDGKWLYLLHSSSSDSSANRHAGVLTIINTKDLSVRQAAEQLDHGLMAVGPQGVLVAGRDKLLLVTPQGRERALADLPTDEQVYSAAIAGQAAYVSMGPPVKFAKSWGEILRVPLQGGVLKPVTAAPQMMAPHIILIGGDEDRLAGAWRRDKREPWTFWMLDHGRMKVLSGGAPRPEDPTWLSQ